MSLPQHDTAELTRWVNHIVTRWKLGHDVNFSIMQAVCLGMAMTRADFLCVVRAYCDMQSENKRLGKLKDKPEP